MKKPILQIGNPVLESLSKEVKFPLDKKTKLLLQDLKDTAKSVGEKGAGLSAPQIGNDLRMAICRRVDIEELVLRLNKKSLIKNGNLPAMIEKIKILAKDLPENTHVLLDDNLENAAKYFDQNVGENFTKADIKHIFKEADDVLWLTIINPELTKENNYDTIYWEGCLSVGLGKSALYGPVGRTEKISFEYYDEEGNKKMLDTRDYFAHVILHEVDHLDGILFLSRIENIENIWKSGDLDEYIKIHKKYPESK